MEYSSSFSREWKPNLEANPRDTEERVQKETLKEPMKDDTELEEEPLKDDKELHEETLLLHNAGQRTNAGQICGKRYAANVLSRKLCQGFQWERQGSQWERSRDDIARA